MGLLARFRSRFDAAVGRAPVVDAVIEPPRTMRNDGWVNQSLGYGTWRDKTQHATYCPNWRIHDFELDALYYHNALAARIVDLVPEHSFRAGYELESEENSEGAKSLQEQAEELGIDAAVQEAMTWGRLWGGALLILGVNDGQDPIFPLREGAKGIQFLNIVDRRYSAVYKYYDAVGLGKYGQPEIYQIVSQSGGLFFVHESRVIRFDGVPVDVIKRRELAGWSYSVLQRVYESLRDFAMAYGSVGGLISDAAQGVFKLKGLIDGIAGDEGSAIQLRMQLVDLMRSTMKSIVLDSENEDFTRIATPLQGIPELLDRVMMKLASDTGYPVTLLMGRSAAGMNATGEGDVRNFYDTIASLQKKQLTPILKRLYGLIGELPSDANFEWCPLWEPTDVEKADIEQKEAQADLFCAQAETQRVQSGVLMPEEIALANYVEGESGEGEIRIKRADRLKSLKNETELMLNPRPDPPPLAPGNVPGNAPKPGQPKAPVANAPRKPGS